MNTTNLVPNKRPPSLFELSIKAASRVIVASDVSQSVVPKDIWENKSFISSFNEKEQKKLFGCHRVYNRKGKLIYLERPLDDFYLIQFYSDRGLIRECLWNYETSDSCYVSDFNYRKFYLENSFPRSAEKEGVRKTYHPNGALETLTLICGNSLIITQKWDEKGSFIKYFIRDVKRCYTHFRSNYVPRPDEERGILFDITSKMGMCLTV